MWCLFDIGLVAYIICFFTDFCTKESNRFANNCYKKIKAGIALTRKEKVRLIRRYYVIIATLIFSFLMVKDGYDNYKAEQRAAKRHHYEITHQFRSNSSYHSKNDSSKYYNSNDASRRQSYNYSGAENYAENNVEEYIESGDYENYDEAYEAALDDYEYDHDY